MCGRYVLLQQIKYLQEYYKADSEVSEFRPSYNVAPTQLMPVVVGGNSHYISRMKWGLVPSSTKDPAIGYKMINARAEGIENKPAFRSALKARRCLVPSSGFYEWKKEGALKQPYFIRLQNQEVFSLAGLYELWKTPDGQELSTYTIITTKPNLLMEGIHDCMPVIMPRQNEEGWLDNSITDPNQLTRLLQPYSANQMEAYTVSTAVNKVTTNTANLIEPINSL